RDATSPVANDQIPRLLPTVGLAEEEHDLGSTSNGQRDRRLKGAARIEAGPDPSREPMSRRERRRMIRRPVASEKLRPVGGPGRLGPAEVGKRDASAELAPRRVTREHRTRLPVDLGD